MVLTFILIYFEWRDTENQQYFYTFFISRSSIRITIIISSLTLQDIKQNVSETLADQGIKEPLLSFLSLFKQRSCQQQTTRYSSILQLLNRSQIFSGHPVSTVSSETEC